MDVDGGLTQMEHVEVGINDDLEIVLTIPEVRYILKSLLLHSGMLHCCIHYSCIIVVIQFALLFNDFLQFFIHCRFPPLLKVEVLIPLLRDEQ